MKLFEFELITFNFDVKNSDESIWCGINECIYLPTNNLHPLYIGPVNTHIALMDKSNNKNNHTRNKQKYTKTNATTIV